MNAADIDLTAGVAAASISLGDLMARADGADRASWMDLPNAPGVYAVCLPDWKDRPFSGVPGRACHANPEQPRELREKRCRILEGGPTDILYLGKAARLRRRVPQLVRFSLGRACNHKGGAWLWQLQGIDDAELRMWCFPSGGPDPREIERELLARFRHDHGEWPLANRQP